MRDPLNPPQVHKAAARARSAHWPLGRISGSASPREVDAQGCRGGPQGARSSPEPWGTRRCQGRGPWSGDPRGSAPLLGPPLFAPVLADRRDGMLPDC
ncbi:hypothetical protein NDU88_003630 [Pleurodeles waltl]|uniref:Uncharacterized protein n=1 Tax=Pleurodeles waltl TaxID=8319 RepID=A0AAV7UD28_PLEWA|nr:hypothetical protein NDU88_003630 [Pleurodeles waltl]